MTTASVPASTPENVPAPATGPVRAIACSPRAGGNSDTATALFARGFVEAGGRIDVTHLRQYEVAPCISCYHCERDPAGSCPLSATDQSAPLFDMLYTAPALFIAAPIYFYHLPAQFKAFIDRGQSHWVRRARGDADLTRLPARPAWITLLAGRKQGERLFEGSLITLRYFLRVFNFELAAPLTLLGCDGSDAVDTDAGLSEQVLRYGRDAARQIVMSEAKARHAP